MWSRWLGKISNRRFEVWSAEAIGKIPDRRFEVWSGVARQDTRQEI